MSNPLLLVHGGFQGAWIWDRCLNDLKQKFEVYTPTLKGMGIRANELNANVGLKDHVDDICEFIDRLGLKKLVLLGHSYGGMVIAGVAKRKTNAIVKLVYLDAVIPRSQESLLDILGPEAHSVFQGEGIITPFNINNYGFETDEQKEWATPLICAQSTKCFTEGVEVLEKGEAPHMKQVFIHCTKSLPIMISQAERARSLGMKVIEIDSPHSPMVTHTKEFTDIILHQI